MPDIDDLTSLFEAGAVSRLALELLLKHDRRKRSPLSLRVAENIQATPVARFWLCRGLEGHG
jgi:hypothetical protein